MEVRLRRAARWALIAIAGAALLVAGAVVLTERYRDRQAEELTAESPYAFILRDDAAMSDVRELEDILRAQPGVARVTYVSKAEAYRRFREMIAEDSPELADEVEPDALPASLDVVFRDEAVVAEVIREAKGWSGYSRTVQADDEVLFKKPIIYLYPEEDTLVDVWLQVDGRVTSSDPQLAADGSWHVLARPSGELIDLRLGGRHAYLFWEAEMSAQCDMSSGAVVGGSETRSFLSGALTQLGLSDSETTAFIEYWAPQMETNAYNLIRFEGPGYVRRARLRVEPEPDTVIRVFMVYVPLDRPIQVLPQALPATPERHGFVLVEWGGAALPSR